MPKLKSSVVLLILLLCCPPAIIAQTTQTNLNFRKEMRELVMDISKTAKAEDPDFIVIPQNGIELTLKRSSGKHIPARSYLKSISAVAQEDLFFGYEQDDKATPVQANAYLLDYLELVQQQNKVVFAIDYAYSDLNIERSYLLNLQKGFISTATIRNLNQIPIHPVNRENNRNINKIEDARNFLYLLNFENFESKEELIEVLGNTNYDLLIMDAFFYGDHAFSREEIEVLKKKKNGASRLVLAYMSIGEAEDYRFYWKDSWRQKRPEWLTKENPNWEGNYKVRYWHPHWKDLIYKKRNSYLRKITSAGFDGVYLDIIDAFEYFENTHKTGLNR